MSVVPIAKPTGGNHETVAPLHVLFERPQQAYTVIAVIRSDGETVFDSFDDLRDEMTAEAAKLGGDALILGPESTVSEFILTGTAMIESDIKKLRGEVIVFDRGPVTPCASNEAIPAQESTAHPLPPTSAETQRDLPQSGCE